MKEENITLVDQFLKIVRLLGKYRFQIGRDGGYMGDPHSGQGRVLAILKIQPEISQKDLAYLLDIRPQSLGEILSKLEKNKYITRTTSEEDKRVTNIRLTEEGRKVAEQAQQMQEKTNELFTTLSEEEQLKLEGLLEKVIKELESKTGSEGMPNYGYRGGFEGRKPPRYNPHNHPDNHHHHNPFGRRN